jgi:hypothetical protein
MLRHGVRSGLFADPVADVPQVTAQLRVLDGPALSNPPGGFEETLSGFIVLAAQAAVRVATHCYSPSTFPS